MVQEEELDPQTWRGLDYLESVAGPGAVAELVGAYQRDVQDRIDRMKVALEAGDIPLLGRLAHDLKSNSATVGALRLSGLAARIERAAIDEQSLDFFTLISEIEEGLPRVLAALQERLALYPA